MIFSILLAALNIVFPKEGSRLPHIERCYVIGATEPGQLVYVVGTNLAPVEVHSHGGFVTMFDCVSGTNTLRMISVDAKKPALTNSFTRTFFVQPRITHTNALQLTTKERVYTKLEYAGDVAKEKPAGKAPSEITIVLDAGHGGVDSGALSPHGIGEKDANLRMTKAVRKALQNRGYRVVLTRETDVAIELLERPRIAFIEKADAFVSIHHNAPPVDKDPRDFRYHAVYVWNDIGSELAAKINQSMAGVMGDIKNNGVVHANFAVTRNPEIPSCLVEIDFITTPESELDCWDVKRRGLIADAIADGIANWLK